VGDLLRIDLTRNSVSEEFVPSALTRELIGAKGLGTHYLCAEVGPEVAPLDPRNKLVFAVGPMAGTAMLGSNRYSVFFLSPLTGGYCECYSGGNLTPQFAKTGYKVVIVEGRAERPTYLEISDQGVGFHDARDVWGLDAYQTEERLLARTANRRAQACVIGPAGERMVRFACVNNNRWHQLGRGGPGAVFGSKNLKGIVWHGERPVQVARPDEFKALARDLMERAKDDPGAAAYRRGGTLNLVRTLNGIGAFPTRYWRKGTLPGFERITVETMLAEHGTKHEVCPPCTFRCVKLNQVFTGRHAGLQIEGPEYETAYAFGGLCEITDLAEIMWLNDICDRLGVDTMTAGNLCALAIEASRRGLIGERLDYGDPDGVAAFLTAMCLREGIGDVWADGILRVEREYGLEGVAVHVKGMEPAGYEPRVMKGMGLAYAATTRGACHLRATMYKPELTGVTDPQAVEGKAAVYCEWEDRLLIMDTLLYCRFYRDLLPWPFITAVVNAAVGTDYTEADLHGVANRIITMTHAFNLARGIGRESERLPYWISDRAMEDEAARKLTQAEMDVMMADYYRIRGWE
jgi:aldehyde:ferredoxin oxidoreductase